MSARFLKIAFLLSVGGSLSVPLFAQSTDQAFARRAALGGMAEAKLGQLAQQNGSSDTVKNFGQLMEMDHTNANNQLKEIASRDNISLPTGIVKTDQATYDKLSKMSGPEFDKEFAEGMVMDHEKTIALFKKEAMEGQIPDLKKFAAETLPTLEEHLKRARDMQKGVSKEH